MNLTPRFDSIGRSSLSGPISRAYTGNLAVGPVSATDHFRSYLSFDLSSARKASAVTLDLDGAGSAAENNTSALPQVFTLFGLASDWHGTPQPGPIGNSLATIKIETARGNDTRNLRFDGPDLTAAFNAAVGGMLYLGIRSDAEGTAARSFKWLGSTEDQGHEPTLTCSSATPSSSRRSRP